MSHGLTAVLLNARAYGYWHYDGKQDPVNLRRLGHNDGPDGPAQRGHYRVETAADGVTGLARAREGNFDAIILDVMLPGKNGFDVCRDLRQQSITTPILMLTARGQVIDKVLGPEAGRG